MGVDKAVDVCVVTTTYPKIELSIGGDERHCNTKLSFAFASLFRVADMKQQSVGGRGEVFSRYFAALMTVRGYCVKALHLAV